MRHPVPRSATEAPRRARRGFPTRPINGRLYRFVWLLVIVPAAIAALSVTEPASLPPPSLPASFDGTEATALSLDFASSFPDRQPGTPGAREATEWVALRLAGSGLRVERQEFDADLPGLGERRLVNLVATTRPREGAPRSSDTIIVVAHRDNSGRSPGANDNASGTGVLLQLARELGTVALDHTLVFVSTDGGAYGGLGADRLARAAAADPENPLSPQRALALVNLDSIGGTGDPQIVLAGDTPAFASPSLTASTDAVVLEETGSRAETPNPGIQLLDLAVPVALTDQGPFLAEGVSAVTLTTSGDRPPRAEIDLPERVDAASIATMGRIAQSLVASLDAAAEVARGTASYVYVGGRALRGWAIALTLLTALLPPIAVLVDVVARGRTRGLRLTDGLRSYRSRLLVWLWVGGLVGLFAVVGLLPDGVGRPLPPGATDATDWRVGALVAIGVLGLLGALLARPRLVRRSTPTIEAELGGHAAAMLALVIVSLAIAIVNPFALVFVLPSLHAWLWLPHVRHGSVLGRLGLYALGLLGPVGFLVALAFRLDLGLDAPWYALTLVTTGTSSIALFVLLLAWAAAATQLAVYVGGRYAPYPTVEEGRPVGPIRGGLRLLAGHPASPPSTRRPAEPAGATRPQSSR